jgi:hypothetical protein
MRSNRQFATNANPLFDCLVLGRTETGLGQVVEQTMPLWFSAAPRFVFGNETRKLGAYESYPRLFASRCALPLPGWRNESARVLPALKFDLGRRHAPKEQEAEKTEPDKSDE